MIDFESDYFQKLTFTPQQLKQYFQSAKKDLKIAQDSNVAEVVFKFSYDAFIKLGVTLIAHKGYKVRSVMGHHMRIIEKLSQLLQNQDIEIYGNQMRRQRNIDFYDGGILVTEKESKEFLSFVEKIFNLAAQYFLDRK